MARRPSAKRSRLLDELMLQARRSGIARHSAQSRRRRPRRRQRHRLGVSRRARLDRTDHRGRAGQATSGSRPGPSPGRSTGSSGSDSSIVARPHRSAQGHRRSRPHAISRVVEAQPPAHRLFRSPGPRRSRGINDAFDDDHLDGDRRVAAAEQRAARRSSGAGGVGDPVDGGGAQCAANRTDVARNGGRTAHPCDHW